MYTTTDRSIWDRIKTFLTRKLNEIYGENRTVKPLKEYMQYKLINDSDRPGIIETMDFETSNNHCYSASYWHNDSYREFKKTN